MSTLSSSTSLLSVLTFGLLSFSVEQPRTRYNLRKEMERYRNLLYRSMHPINRGLADSIGLVSVFRQDMFVAGIRAVLENPELRHQMPDELLETKWTIADWSWCARNPRIKCPKSETVTHMKNWVFDHLGKLLAEHDAMLK